MRRAALMGGLVLFVGLAAGTAQARTCRPEAAPVSAPVLAETWRIAADFAYRTGVDPESDAGAMLLVRRLRSTAGWAALRPAMEAWPQTESAINTAARDDLLRLAGVMAGLQRLCDQLDALALDPDPGFDETAWSLEASQLEDVLDQVIAQTGPRVDALIAAQDLIAVASANYARAGYQANPHLRIGPDIGAVAEGVGAVAGRWRALLSDLRNARRILPVTPEIGSERPLVALTAALTAITRVLAEVEALTGQRLPRDVAERYATGDYLYDDCPMIVDGQWYRLESGYWTTKLGQMATLGAQVPLEMTASTFINLGSVTGLATRLPQIDRWQFNRVGYGYWMIRNGAATPGVAALDVENNAAKFYPLTLTETTGNSPRFSGQYWRCGATSVDGKIRLFNYFLSEDYSIDTFNDVASPIMANTGNFAAQYWIVHPATAP